MTTGCHVLWEIAYTGHPDDLYPIVARGGPQRRDLEAENERAQAKIKKRAERVKITKPKPKEN